ncbi:MAG: hypothetical protein V3G42_16750 [Oscillospiraceae bacterium]
MKRQAGLTNTGYVLQDHTEPDGQSAGATYRRLFGTDYPESCQLIFSVDPDSVPDGWVSSPFYLGKYGLEDEKVEVTEHLDMWLPPLRNATSHSVSKSNDYPNGHTVINWDTSANLRISIGSRSTVIDGETVYYRAAITAILEIPAIPFENGGTYGFPVYTEISIPSQADISFWAMDENFYGFPYVKNSGIAPKYQKGFSNLYLGAHHVKKLYLGDKLAKRFCLGSQVVLESG